MIPIGTWSFLHFFLFLICPLLGVISCVIFIIFIIKILFEKVVKKTPIQRFLSKKMKHILIAFLILNTWNSCVIYIFWKTADTINTSIENKEKRRRFILPTDYVYDGFVFPKGTLINSNNVHDNGERYRYLTLTELEQARFPRPVKIAGVWANSIRISSDYVFLVQLAKDQEISPVYESDKKGEYTIDPSRPSLFCKKNQIAQYTVNSDYYPHSDYTEEDWHTLEDERFEPKLWLFKGCFSAPPIYVERPYPQTRLHDLERMSNVTNPM